MPFTASGLLPSAAPVAVAEGGAASGCVQVWVIVSGLYWKTITFGTGTGRNVGMNSTSAPFRTTPLIRPPPRPGRPRPGRATSTRPISSMMRRARRSGFPCSAALAWTSTCKESIPARPAGRSRPGVRPSATRRASKRAASSSRPAARSASRSMRTSAGLVRRRPASGAPGAGSPKLQLAGPHDDALLLQLAPCGSEHVTLGD